MGEGESGLIVVPDAFKVWVETLPNNMRRLVSIRDLREIWEPIETNRRALGKAFERIEALEADREKLIREIQQWDPLRR